MKLPGRVVAHDDPASQPSRSSACAWSSACSTTAPQNDHENGTTIPTFTAGRIETPAAAAARLRLGAMDPRGPRRAAHAPRRLGRLRHPLEPRARAGDRAAGQGLLGVRPARHRLRPARRAEPRRARRDLPLDGADPVQPARRRALGARGDRRRLPLAGDHDARAALQPDEAEPRRRARPRPHHPRRHPRSRPRERSSTRRCAPA